ncbi:Orf4 [Human mastadenovirus D]|uniref:Orf4 n=2 Tax=Human mastadenovirus D TaxID=130310 RepID=A0A1J0MSC2_9ADEN|nr:Orf4 [Human adenovirus 39]APD28405.1 Orf4 [Human mastadenovirus D]
MVLPVLPPPPLNDRPGCINWIGMAYNVLADVLRGIRIEGTFVSSEAEELLENLREWLYFSWMTERQQRKDRRRRGICCSRATFCWQKYDKVRKRIHFNVHRGTVELAPPSSLPQGPFTTM